MVAESVPICYLGNISMNTNSLRAYLLATVFISGAISLIVEITALRTLAPYFGNTIFVTSSVISAILGALAIGYYLGGRLSDRQPHLKLFIRLLASSGALTIIIVVLTRLLLPVLSENLSIIIGPPIAAMVFFFLPAVLFGMLSPFTIRLLTEEKHNRIGETAGTVFFWSTAGSILGTLIAAYGLIPFFKTETIYLLCGVALILLAGLLWLATGRSDRQLPARLAIMVILVLVIGGSGTSSAAILYQENGIYEEITIFDHVYDGEPARFLKLDQNNSSAQYHEGDEQVYDYAEYYKLAELIQKPLNRALVLGGGAYTIPAALVREHPQVIVDVVEIEPRLYPLSQQFFRLDPGERLVNHVADGRRFLQESSDQYDFIFSDVYYSLHAVPPHFTTQGFFELAKSRLASDGLFVANLIGTLDTSYPSFVPAEIKTFQSVFPAVRVYAVRDAMGNGIQNIMIVGALSEDIFNYAPALETDFYKNLASRQVDIERLDLENISLLTDSYAPIEYMMAETLKRFKIK